MTGAAHHVLARHSLHLCTASSSSSSSSSSLKKSRPRYHHHQYLRQQGREGKGVNRKRMLLLSLVETSLLASQSSILFSAFAAQEAATAGSEISPFAGVVDIAALGLLAVFAYLGNKKSSENVQSERQKTITNMPSRRNRTPPPKKWY